MLTADQQADSDMIMETMERGKWDNLRHAKVMMIKFYGPDRSISRAGIADAAKRLEKLF